MHGWLVTRLLGCPPGPALCALSTHPLPRAFRTHAFLRVFARAGAYERSLNSSCGVSTALALRRRGVGLPVENSGPPLMG